MKIEKLLFVHIPKTAGLSLNKELTSCFGQSSSLRIGDSSSLQKFKKLSKNELKQFNYITGHMTLNEFRRKGIDYPTITIVRNPIDRLLSMYKYLNQSNHPDHVALKFENIDNFIDYVLKQQAYDNIQCRYIGNDREHSKSVEVIQNETVYVAPLDYFDDMTETLGKILDQQLKLLHINKSNKTKKDSEDRLVIERNLKQCWEEDMKLYEFVRENYFDLKQTFLDKIDTISK